MQIGGLFGATLFVSTIGLALVLVQSSEVPVYIGHYDVEENRLLGNMSNSETDSDCEGGVGKQATRGGLLGVSLGSFSRDVVTYLAGLSALLVMGLRGRVRLSQGVALLCVYVVYVLVVVATDWCRQSRRSRRIAKQLIQQRLSVSLRRNSVFSEHSQRSHSADDELGSYMGVGVYNPSGLYSDDDVDFFYADDCEGDGFAPRVGGGSGHVHSPSLQPTDTLLGQFRGLDRCPRDAVGHDPIAVERYASCPASQPSAGGVSVAHPPTPSGQAPHSPSDLIHFDDDEVTWPSAALEDNRSRNNMDRCSPQTRNSDPDRTLAPYDRSVLKTQRSAPDAQSHWPSQDNATDDHAREWAGVGIEMTLEPTTSPYQHHRRSGEHLYNNRYRDKGKNHTYPPKHARATRESKTLNPKNLSHSSDSSDLSPVDVQAEDIRHASRREASESSVTSPLPWQHRVTHQSTRQWAVVASDTHQLHSDDINSKDRADGDGPSTTESNLLRMHVDDILMAHSADTPRLQPRAVVADSDVPSASEAPAYTDNAHSRMVINLPKRKESDAHTNSRPPAHTHRSIPIIRVASPETSSEQYHKPHAERKTRSLYAEDIDTLVHIALPTPHTPTAHRRHTGAATHTTLPVTRAQSLGPHRHATRDTTTRAVLDIQEEDGLQEARTPQRVMSPIMMGKALESGLSSVWAGPFMESFVQLPGVCWPSLEAPNYERVQLMVEMPFTLIRWLSIPYCDFQDDDDDDDDTSTAHEPSLNTHTHTNTSASTAAYSRVGQAAADGSDGDSDSETSERIVFVDSEGATEYQRWNCAKQVLSYISPVGMSLVVGVASFGPWGLVHTKVLRVVPTGVICVGVGALVSGWLYVSTRRRGMRVECHCKRAISALATTTADSMYPTRNTHTPHNSNLLSVSSHSTGYTGQAREQTTAARSMEDRHVCMYPPPPPTHINTVLSLLGFLSSVAWISLIGNEVVAILTALGLTLHLSTSVLSLSVLAIGNSTGDLVSALAVARKGLYSMALGAIFGGPLFHDCVGLGVSLVSTCLSSPNYEYYFQINTQSSVAAIFVALSMVSSLVAVPLLRYFHTKKMAYAIYLVCLYLLFIIVIVYTTFE
ncbi:hypothetical protein SARC_10685 [Sphaeroforma arctica JP610]|uniref:Sodium/calcium exchanger membrane region domain-containing protein n=1 Tax=Sphaeroforma arctica JP610 TaxID=667725 RepID=A0A0L0FK24_9EUKA|nr:hypothetical protein SARC_10685 [Sphaeroforma arctica JP610]KNC76836.1 hypothetical protein SARC_10685 [Sphaeroforma arctica JP610]|eukprot:XP_014150738.1 hypothetical protein SARC_10685 [Sphaeroforma arctica JP610]